MPTEELKEILFVQWQHTLRTFAVDNASAEQIFTNLVTAYSTPGRFYHTLQHIYQVLNKIQTLQTYTQDLPAVQLAAWFHDVIYDTHAQDNEEKSADYADEALNSLGISITRIVSIKHIILNTKYHQTDVSDFDSQVLLDADLAILAACPVDYQKYANAIRQEYAWVSETEYAQARRQVLEKFLQRQRIYFTPLMFEIAEKFARINLQGEIYRLS